MWRIGWLASEGTGCRTKRLSPFQLAFVYAGCARHKSLRWFALSGRFWETRSHRSSKAEMSSGRVADRVGRVAQGTGHSRDACGVGQPDRPDRPPVGPWWRVVVHEPPIDRITPLSKNINAPIGNWERFLSRNLDIIGRCAISRNRKISAPAASITAAFLPYSGPWKDFRAHLTSRTAGLTPASTGWAPPCGSAAPPSMPP
jgi:hypothetical protein